MNNLLHCLMNYFISFLAISLILQMCSFFDLSKWIISPIILSLDWASTQSCLVLHFGFNLSPDCHDASAWWSELSTFDIVLSSDDSWSACVVWLWLDDLVTALRIDMLSDEIRRNDSITCILHETVSIFATFPMIAAATIAWIELAWIVSSQLSQIILDNAPASTLLFPDL